MLKLQMERDECEETVAHYTIGSGLEAMRRETSSFYHYNYFGTVLPVPANSTPHASWRPEVSGA